MTRRPGEWGLAIQTKTKRLHGSIRGGLLSWMGRGADRAAMLGVNLESKGLLLFVAHDCDLDGLADV